MICPRGGGDVGVGRKAGAAAGGGGAVEWEERICRWVFGRGLSANQKVLPKR